MYLGVDFGTTFSQAATMSFAQLEVLHKYGVYGIPSEFYYDSQEGIKIGSDALAEGQGSQVKNLVTEVKMKLKESFTLDGRSFSSAEIVSAIYKEVISEAIKIAQERGISNSQIEGLVLSHPAKFGIQECNLIREAAKKCLGEDKELKITGMIKEPVAAAIAYYQNQQMADNTNVLVYDLGGGTCDVAIVQSDSKLKERFVVKDSDMLRLGGRDWDKALIDFIIDKIETELAESSRSLDIRNDAELMDTIRREAINAKEKLTDHDNHKIRIFSRRTGEQFTYLITREQFEEITIDLLEATLDKLEEIYNRNSDISSSISEIILVGGSSRMCQVKDGIQRRFPDCTVKLFYPELAVIRGTAVYAEMIGEGNGIKDFIPFSYGVRCLKDAREPKNYVIQNIIFKGQSFPISVESDKFKISNNGKSVDVAVYASECEEEIFPCDGTRGEAMVGRVVLKSPNGLKANEIIYCTLSVNDMSEIEVEAHNENGENISAKFNLTSMPDGSETNQP